MYKSSTRWMLAGFSALALALTSTSFGQGVTTGAITGFVLDSAGKPVAGAKVTATLTNSGTVYSGETRANGLYVINGLRPGGPYAVAVSSAEGSTSDTVASISTGAPYQENLQYQAAGSDVVKLDTVSVSGSSLDRIFNAGTISSTTSFTAADVEHTVSVRGDIQDLANIDPRVNLMQVSASDTQYTISFDGQNPRENLILIDGVSATDNFGLNSNGYAGFGSPVPFEWIQSSSFDISPFDMIYSNFSGGVENFTLKAGTNEFHGGTFTEYEGTNFRGPDPVTNVALGQHEPYQRHRSGVYVGGPIIKNKLFFFAGYDATRIISSPPVQNFIPDNSGGVYSQIIAASQGYGFNPGNFSASNHIWSQNFVAKVDWNISDAHKFEFTFRHTDGEAPNFYNYTSTFETSLSSSWYNTARTNQSMTAKFNSDWSKFVPNLSTEIEATYVRYNGTAKLSGGDFPAVFILGVPGSSPSGSTPPYITFLGQYSAYQDNNIYTWEQEEHAFVDYSLGAHTFKFGAVFDRTGYTDTFIPNVLGTYYFGSVAEYLAGTPVGFTQEVPAPGFSSLSSDVSHYYMLEVSPLIQDNWSPTENFSMMAGVRMDYAYEPQKPVSSTVFSNAYGYTNSTNMSGNYTISPRVGFNWKLPTKLKTQVHGGAGLFLGQEPVVWYENAFNNAGQLNSASVGTSGTTTTVANAAVIPGYVFKGINSPAVTGFATPGALVPSFDTIDPKFHWPANWRETIGIDHELGFWNIVGSINFDFSQVQKDAITRNLNERLATSGPAILPDGAIHYNGTIGASASSVASSTLEANPLTGPVYELTNTDKGGTQVYAFSLQRPMKDGWSWMIGYAHTHATQVDPAPSSVANSDFADNPMVNPNDNVAYRSEYAVPDKWSTVLAKEFDFFKAKNAKTTVSMQFQAQTGQAYSYVFKGDADGSGLSGESLFYVPTGPSDPKVTWANATEETNFFNWLAANPRLAKDAGAIAPRNAFYASWQHVFNLKFEQQVPLYGPFKASLYWQCYDFGNLINKDWGRVSNYNANFNTRTVASTTLNTATNQYIYSFNSTTFTANPTYYPDMSRWAMTIGARLEF